MEGNVVVVATSGGPSVRKNEKGKRTLEDYRLGDVLGEGAYGMVREAFDKVTGVRYAIKACDKAFIVKEKKEKAIMRERTILDLLRDHPNVVKLYSTFQDNTNLYFVTECCSNGELHERISTLGSLSVECARFYTAELILALEYIHGNGVLHRDIKPENMLLDSSYHLKVIDFGCATEVDAANPRARSHTFTGTAEYVPPELLQDNCVSSRATDIWAVGCVLFQMLTGAPPYRGANEFITFKLINDGKLRFPAHGAIPDTAVDLIRRLLDPEMDSRLGYGDDNLQAIKDHPFFDAFDWTDLHKRTPPPLEPLVIPQATVASPSPALSLATDANPSAPSPSSVKRFRLEVEKPLPPGDSFLNLHGAPTDDDDGRWRCRCHRMWKSAKSDWTRFVSEGEVIIHFGPVGKRGWFHNLSGRSFPSGVLRRKSKGNSYSDGCGEGWDGPISDDDVDDDGDSGGDGGGRGDGGGDGDREGGEVHDCRVDQPPLILLLTDAPRFILIETGSSCKIKKSIPWSRGLKVEYDTERPRTGSGSLARDGRHNSGHGSNFPAEPIERIPSPVFAGDPASRASTGSVRDVRASTRHDSDLTMIRTRTLKRGRFYIVKAKKTYCFEDIASNKVARDWSDIVIRLRRKFDSL
eukprot:TRINITY_DN2495_c0_g2_i6.p1 TRINITY_DN2495_c0_g2~~TRINITY_DN2495_c0_g2_i6.p1  ORF type:complete len:637 (-),score=144.09 TRINITY_DN2495_c0_g2_i6:179-2089(-)